MKNIKLLRVLVFSLILLVFVGITGCITHYRVTDPTSNKDYYTTEMKKHGGSVEFKDERTKKTVILNNSEIEQISEEEYSKGIYSEQPVDAPVTPEQPVEAPVTHEK